MAVKDAAEVKATDHSKERQLAELKECSEGKTATKKADNRLRCCLVETLEAFQTLLVMEMEDVFLRFGEYK